MFSWSLKLLERSISPALHRTLQNEQAHSKTNAEEFQDDLKAQIAEKEESISKLTKDHHLWNVCFSLIFLFLFLALWMLRKERSKISTLLEGFSKAGRGLEINLNARRTRVGSTEWYWTEWALYTYYEWNKE